MSATRRPPLLLWLAGPLACASASCGGRAPGPTTADHTPPPPPLAVASSPTASERTGDAGADATRGAGVVSRPLPTGQEVPAACKGADLDLDALPVECQTKTRERAITGLSAELVVDEPSVPRGAPATLTASYVNTTTEDVEVIVRLSCASFEVEAHRDGKRADYVNVDCGFGTGCGGPALRVVVVPGGKLKKRVVYKARVRRVSSQTGCREADVGPLPVGSYTLKLVTSPFFALHDPTTKLSAKLTVR